MKAILILTTLIASSSVIVRADDASADPVIKKHQEGSSKVADGQDELSADVQQLTIEQTVPKVIELLTQVEKIMDEATDNLAAYDTGGNTIAAQTEVIEKIYEAAKEKQKKGGSGKPGGAMMEMMERMMGKTPGGDQPGKGKGDKPGDQAGQGSNGDSNAANTPDGGPSGGKTEVRRVPKAAGSAGRALPEEFNKALDAYNRGAQEKVK